MRSKPAFALAIVALCCVLFATPTPVTAKSHTGRLTIKRSANFGKNLGVDLWIDGQPVGRLPFGHDFTRSLPVGRHEIRAEVTSRRQSNPAFAHLTVEAGKSYRLTAAWSGQKLVLR